MSKRKQERLIQEVIVDMGGTNIQVCHTAKGHQSFYFNVQLGNVLHRLSRPLTVSGTPGQSLSGRHVRNLVRRQIRYHSEPIKKP